uniref:Mamu class II histocompatibility antigen, DR alpha chain n=1 Tax=Danio rerio TaxID=7955 RepID=F1QNN0_DANRE|nr:mamu class II histocompatibility antigen, DR alpha chain-like [Danio rerio]|eukprot:XP_005167290.2 mamu class II histocompatibility antigen, DR alpha chain-like [Danio rerio]
MELHIIILSLAIVLSTGTEFEHEVNQIQVCSNTEQEFFIGYDGEEIWHADIAHRRGVKTTPSFAQYAVIPDIYERALAFLDFCKYDLHAYIKYFNNPPPEMDAPQTSIYSKGNVQLGIQNTLVCHVTGFYPPFVNISWTKNNVIVTEGMSLSQYHPRVDGTFNIFSTLKYTPAEGDIYSCTVNHRTLQGQPQTRIWDVDVVLPNFGPSVFCGVGLTIGLLSVAIETFFLFKRKKSN